MQAFLSCQLSSLMFFLRTSMCGKIYWPHNPDSMVQIALVLSLHGLKVTF